MSYYNIKPSSTNSYSYKSNYRDQTVSKSVKNYNDKVIEALNNIYLNSNLTVYDFEIAFISKLLSDDLVEACNISKNDLARTRVKPQTNLRLTKDGCLQIGQPFLASEK